MILLYGSSLIGSIAEVLALLIVFALILSAAYYVTKYFGKSYTGSGQNGNIRVVETVRIAPDKYLQIVEAAGKVFLISITKGEVRLVSELDKEGLKQTLEGMEPSKVSFKDIFQKMTKK